MSSTSKRTKFASLRTPMKELDINHILKDLFRKNGESSPSPFDFDDLDESFNKNVSLASKRDRSFAGSQRDLYEGDDPYRATVAPSSAPSKKTSPPRESNGKRAVNFRSERKLRDSSSKPTSSSLTPPRITPLSTPVVQSAMTGLRPLTTETPPMSSTPFTSTPLNGSSSSTGRLPYKFNVDLGYESPTKGMTNDERSNILLGITCYVEARNGKEDVSASVKDELVKLGAKVEKYFTRKVTHVIFKEGRMSTYLKAKQWGIPLVSVLWIDACKFARNPVDASLYRPKKMEKYDNVPSWAFLKKRRFGALLKIIRGGSGEKGDEKADSLIEQRSQDVSTPLMKLRRGDDKAISDTKHRRKALPGTKGVFSKKKLDFDSQFKLVQDAENGTRHSAPADLETASTSTDDSEKRLIKKLTGGYRPGAKRSQKRRLLDLATQIVDFESVSNDTSDEQSSRCSSPPVFEAIVDSPRKRRLGSDSRGSLMPLAKTAAPRDQQGNKKNSPCLVLSGFTPEKKQNFLDTIRKLGNFETEKNVTSRTTHLVTYPPVKRTINVVKALSRGCWILDADWIAHSEQCGKWMPEEAFELTSFSPAVKKNRLEKQAFGKDFVLDLFSKCGRIFVSRNTQPSQSDLTELLRLGRAALTRVIGRAVIIVGGTDSTSDCDARTVKETWILDCITQGKTLNTDDYRV